jgi:hypothetical protein
MRRFPVSPVVCINYRDCTKKESIGDLFPDHPETIAAICDKSEVASVVPFDKHRPNVVNVTHYTLVTCNK